ncbi:MAG: hypothetical protein AAFX06_33760 [Planctomycetota bacterium]
MMHSDNIATIYRHLFEDTEQHGSVVGADKVDEEVFAKLVKRLNGTEVRANRFEAQISDKNIGELWDDDAINRFSILRWVKGIDPPLYRCIEDFQKRIEDVYTIWTSGVTFKRTSIGGHTTSVETYDEEDLVLLVGMFSQDDLGDWVGAKRARIMEALNNSELHDLVKRASPLFKPYAVASF